MSGRRSRIEQLQKPLRDLIDHLIREGVPQKDIVERMRPMLEEVGEKPLSAAGVNRYYKKMDKVGRKIQEAREVAEVWMARIGDVPTGDMGRYIVEILRMLAFEVSLKAAEGGGAKDLDPKLIGDLALAVRRLETADSVAVRREKELRAAWREKAADAAEEAAKNEAERNGNRLPAKALRNIREQVYGIFDDD